MEKLWKNFSFSFEIALHKWLVLECYFGVIHNADKTAGVWVSVVLIGEEKQTDKKGEKRVINL